MACASSDSRLHLSDHLNCPICLEVYKKPRALGCLHTFCEKCIHTFIVKKEKAGRTAPSIQCPVCRTETPSPAPGRAATEWARELPLNYAIVPLLESLGSDPDTKLCDSCKRVKTSSTAVSFCIDCGQYQCQDCRETHNRFPVMADHQVVGLEQGGEDPGDFVTLGKVEFCHDHPNEKIKFYCEDDKKLCCSSCAIVDHRPCKKVVDAKQLGRQIRDDGKSEVLKTTLEELRHQLMTLINHIDSNSDTIEKQTAEIIQKIKAIRRTIVQKIEMVVRQVEAKCEELNRQHRLEMSDRKAKCESCAAAIFGSCTLLESVMNKGTETQLLITYNKVGDQAVQYGSTVRAFQETDCPTVLKLEIEKVVENLCQFTGPLAKVTKTPKMKPILKDKSPPEAIATKVPTYSMQQVSRKDVKERESVDPPRYTGATFLPDGRLVAVDYNNKLCCSLDVSSYEVLADTGIEIRPKSVATVSANEVVAITPGDGKLQFISVGKTVQLGRVLSYARTQQPVCITNVNTREFAVGFQVGFGLLTADDREKTYIQEDSDGREIKFTFLDDIAADGNRACVYQSCSSTDAVYCIGFDGTARFKKSIESPRGVCLDREGNLYVCNWLTGAVLQFSPAGEQLGSFTTGVGRPHTICFNPSNDTILVLNCPPTTKAVTFRLVPKA